MTLPPPDIGHAYFYDEINPPLDVGEYELHVNQKVLGVDGVPQSIANISKTKFEITGPRFRLNPTDIHSLYPPPNAQGPFIGRLPQVVLTRRTLPWERALGKHVPNAHRKAPWMAVLLLQENELTLLDKVTVGSIVDHNKTLGGYEAPVLSSDERSMNCLGIELTLTKFQQIAPKLNELKWLTHGRQVNTEDKELLGMDEDGWFAVVVGNRLPRPGRKYVACLVSLEGMYNLLPTNVPHTNKNKTAVIDVIDDIDDVVVGIGDAITHLNLMTSDAPIEVESATSSPAVNDFTTLEGAQMIEFKLEQYLFPNVDITPVVQKVRLVTLARWQFETNAIPGTFQTLMVDLPKKGGVAMLGANQNSATLPDVTVQTAYQVALDSGHVPLKHVTREGKTTVSWYRGPLVPVGVKHEVDAGPYHTSDQARRIDPLTGLENLGYASGFELGRLMALADTRFSVELLRWRRDAHLRIASRIQLETVSVIQDAIQAVLGKMILAKDIYHSGLLGELINQIYHDYGITSLIQPADFTGFGGIHSTLPGLNPDAMLTLPDATTVRIGDIVGLNNSLEGIGVMAAPELNLESNFNNLVTNAMSEFQHLQDAFQKNFES